MYVLSDHSKLFRKCTLGWRCCTIACKRETRVIFYPTCALDLIYLGPAYHHVNRSLLIPTGRLRTVDVFPVVASLPPTIAVVTLRTFYLGKHDLLTVYLGKLVFLSVTDFSLGNLPRENFIIWVLDMSRKQ